MPARHNQSEANLPAEMLGPVLSLNQLWSIVWARKKIIVAVTVLVTILAAIVLTILPRTYEGVSTLLVAFRADDPVSGTESTDISNIGFMPTQIDLIGSQATMLQAVEKLALTGDEEFMVGYSGAGDVDSRLQWAANALRERIGINAGKDSRFVYLSARDGDPVKAAALSNAVAESYVLVQRQQFIEPARSRIEIFSSQLDQLKQKVDEAQARVAEFRKKTGLINLTEEVDVETERLSTLDQNLARAQEDRQVAELRLARVRSGDTVVIQSPLVQNLKSQLQLKEALYAELRVSLGPRHPQIVTLEGELEQIRAQYNRELGVHIESARREVSTAKAIEGRLERELREQRQKILAIRANQDQSSSLLQELESATKVYQAALDGFERAQLGTHMAGSNVSIVSRASPPSLPVGSNRNKLLTIMIATGLLATLGALLAELLNRRVRCREDVELDLGVPVLAELGKV